METKWTREQSEVIHHRGGNLLVSAGAGAGKTAVLVERIIGRLLDEERPIGINELLVVTFTRAAAAEMKERIGKALEEKINNLKGEEAEEVYAKRLMEQYALLPQAEISTIDSFCKSVIMEHFQKTDLDPSFRIVDETELSILKTELLDEFLEEKYEAGEEGFLKLVEFFERGKKDGKLSSLILDLLRVSDSFPDREAWFFDRKKELLSDLLEHEKMPEFLELILQKIEGAERFNEDAIILMYEEGGPLQYEEALLDDKEKIKNLLAALKIEELFALFSDLKFTTLGRGKPKGPDGKALPIDEDKKNQTKGLRDRYKNLLDKKMRERYFFEELSVLSEEHSEISLILTGLLDLSLEFGRRYQEMKKRKNLVDFSDLSHIALKLLVDEEGRPTKVAEEYRDIFAEIMIDEYQDSNLIQDSLLNAISRERIGEPNVFMVGDVKQSIYGFRQAEPKIFLRKYHKYGEDGPYKKISLSKNFRSGEAVINTVNTVFQCIMRKETGGLVYDEEAALKLGKKEEKADFEKTTELLLFDDELVEEADKDPDFLDRSIREKEAFMIGTRIKELKKAGVSYKDITILLRSMTNWSEDFVTVLSSMGIPVISDTSMGYFRAYEVQVMLSFLQIIDNPRQDIPLATVLLSPAGGFHEAELSEMRLSSDEGDYYEALLSYEGEKAKNFLSYLWKKRKEAVYLPVSELLYHIYEETGFYDFVSGMKGGEVRAANLDMLLVKAEAYERTSLSGLRNFVRYIEKIRKYELDFGEAEAASSGDAVKIMSIHKSKGLEFPIVFVSGLAKKFNDSDAMKMVVVHKELGIGTDYFNPATREGGKSFLKSMISDKIRLDQLSEEIRVLYVALTRAKEKLILTGALSSASEKIKKMREEAPALAENISELLESSSFLELLLPPLLKEDYLFFKAPVIYGMKDIYEKEGEVVSGEKEFIEMLKERAKSEFSNSKEREAYQLIERERRFSYPYEEAIKLSPSITVSELKRLHLTEEEGYEEAKSSVTSEEKKRKLLDGFLPYEPDFSGEEPMEKALSSTERGTLVHKLLNKLDFTREYSEEEIRELAAKFSLEESLDEFYISAIALFTKTPLAKRMGRAAERGELFLELPFSLGFSQAVADEEETMVVQGIIDAWFIEDGEAVLLDYKTDRVKKEDGEEVLRHRYRSQLAYYAEAIKRFTGKKVKERLIYSLYLQKEIPLSREGGE